MNTELANTVRRIRRIQQTIKMISKQKPAYKAGALVWRDDDRIISDQERQLKRLGYTVALKQEEEKLAEIIVQTMESHHVC